MYIVNVFSQRILPLPSDSMFARSSSANRLSSSGQSPGVQFWARNQMPHSASDNIASSSSANAVIAAFDPLASTRCIWLHCFTVHALAIIEAFVCLSVCLQVCLLVTPCNYIKIMHSTITKFLLLAP